ncbi:MAG: YhfC family glutamic-type intramembrane protease, partial [Desulfurococcaceae archaeon]
LGFGITEALYIGAIGMLATLLSGLEVPTTATYMQLVSALERFSATLFHIGSSLFIVDMIKKNKRLTGLLTIILLHGVLDTLAALYQLTGNFVVLLLVEFLVFLAGLFLTLKLYRYALTGSPEEIIW